MRACLLASTSCLEPPWRPKVDRMKPLVPYAASDGEDSDSEPACESEVKRAASATWQDSGRSRGVYTSLGVARHQAVQGDWLCYVFVPLSSDSESIRLLRKAFRILNDLPSVKEHDEKLERVKQPHISLTRPILLRRHECDRLLPLVREAIETYKRQQSLSQTRTRCVKRDLLFGCGSHANRLSAGHRLAVAFASFASLPSEDNNRTFWAAEVGQGWAELRGLTSCLDATLSALHARPYYDEARFHCSFAHLDAGHAAPARLAAQALNQELGPRLRHCPVTVIDKVGVATGPSIKYVHL